MANPLTDTYERLQQAEQLCTKGDLTRARAICEALVSGYPDYFGAVYTLGLIHVDQSQYPQALGFLVRAAMLNPRSWKVMTALSAVYLELGANEMAAQTLEQALLINPRDPSIFLTLGEIYREEREYELAADAYNQSLRLDATLDAAAIGLGSCCIHLGQYAEAAKIFKSLLKRGTRSTGILSELNNLPASFVTVDLLSEAKKTVRRPDKSEAEFETSMAFIRAASLHKTRQFFDAWEHLVPANRALHLIRKREASDLARTQRANLAQLETKRIKTHRLGNTGPRTISLFILGPSRSGKTTLETLVSTLDGVKRGYENPSVERAVRRAFQSAGLLASKMFEVLPPTLDAECREHYLDELTRRAGQAQVFTNTHPARIHDAARLASAIPNVRFIFIRRSLEDNMLRIYMRKYQSGNAYAYNLHSIREHILW